ncbi:ATP-grasp domain-containing protein [Falsarthrobacter nasiphocae]|uniref:Biotin carboxylase n=1 Tax=Falsarthrobacter nasiphocae TaxID=189863 RepID=A0AAE3YJ07_9MICC|nr:ATP-grasp domain-containing protein [Falsarthrobacter nasiphocae]MDR6892931.1 biotin carboxylase [Falsarthrobacter nasiphocae]
MPTDVAGKTLTVVGVAAHREAAFHRWAEMGLSVHAVVSPETRTESWQHLAAGVTRLNALDTRGLMEAIPVSDGVVTLSEFSVQAVATLAELLSLPGVTTSAANVARNKAHLRRVLRASGLDGDLASAEIRSERDLEAFFAIHGEESYVLKPADSSGSAGVVRVTSFAEAAQRFKAVRRWSFGGDVVIEEYVAGPEYSYEGWVQGSEAVLAAVVRKRTTADFVEIGHTATHAPNAGAWALIRSALRLLGVADGVFHAEVKLSPDGPRIIEIALRPAGGLIPTLVSLTTNVDLYEAQARIAVGAHVFEPVPNGTSAAIAHVVGQPMSHASPETLRAISRLPNVPEVYQAPRLDGDLAPLSGNDARAGYALAHGVGPTVESDARRAARMLADALCIDMTPVT